VTGDGPAQPERFLTAGEVAEVLGMSRDWVYERALAGDLPSYKLPGGKRRFLHSELLEAVRRFRDGPPDEVQRLGGR
jgi:excisionase family DNA binding protein